MIVDQNNMSHVQIEQSKQVEVNTINAKAIKTTQDVSQIYGYGWFTDLLDGIGSILRQTGSAVESAVMPIGDVMKMGGVIISCTSILIKNHG